MLLQSSARVVWSPACAPCKDLHLLVSSAPHDLECGITPREVEMVSVQLFLPGASPKCEINGMFVYEENTQRGVCLVACPLSSVFSILMHYLYGYR